MWRTGCDTIAVSARFRAASRAFSGTRVVERGVLLLSPVDEMRRSEVLNTNRTGGVASEAPSPGSIFSFVPAHGACRAGAVAQQLSRSLSEGLGIAVLLADFDRRA